MKKELLLWILGSLFVVNGHYLAHTKETEFGIAMETDGEKEDEPIARDASQYCQNGGFLNDSGNCSCPNYFNGMTCSTSLCMNGGYLSDNTDDSYCQCPPGYIGVHCETELCKSSMRASGPLNAFSRKTTFSLIVHNRLDTLGQSAVSLLQRALNSSPVNGYFSYRVGQKKGQWGVILKKTASDLKRPTTKDSPWVVLQIAGVGGNCYLNEYLVQAKKCRNHFPEISLFLFPEVGNVRTAAGSC
uniref:EGF-like domain-containing protein n=1 Tax=Plectus sambesii TaxID=2011161 RepID=A0A914VD44_9BILA